MVERRCAECEYRRPTALRDLGPIPSEYRVERRDRLDG